ncbi:MAG: SAM-dependent methyltransferase [Oscillatoriales cyanobacterium CG2_30_44_21]|nr:MAG: SAM-dependent methyltransferase [Oscillatoriales cyanobacterium CG2_30_44_21]
MVTNSKEEHEYLYDKALPGHHHNYLVPPLQKMLSGTSLTKGVPLKILDIGCGNGSLSNFFASLGYEVIGIEDSKSGIALAKQNFPNCEFIHSSVYDLPYQDLEDKFDIVLSTEVIEHLLYPRILIQAAKRCLKPDGKLILTTPYHGYLKNLALALTGNMDKHFTVLWDGGHIKFFSPKTLSALITEEGFTELEWGFAGRIPFLWKSMLVSARLSD